MKVPCMREYGVIVRDADSKEPVSRQHVSIYNDVCSSCDLCNDRECDFYNDTVEGTKVYHKGLSQSMTLEGMRIEQKKEIAYREKYGVKL